VLENLQRTTEAGAEEVLKAAASRKQLTPEQLHVALALATGNEEVLDEVEPFLLADTRGAWRAAGLRSAAVDTTCVRATCRLWSVAVRLRGGRIQPAPSDTSTAAACALPLISPF
jgi:hypothetical protein